MYSVLCMDSDGDFITDGIFDTVDDACDSSANMGSKWIFYPFHFIVKKGCKNHQEILNSRILDSGIDSLKGRSIKTAMKYIMEKSGIYL